ncbi:helix-turn-helix domain-containing protein [Parathermosynechococcus lividus]
MVKTRYQFRIHPTPAQQSNLAKRFGCCRVVWNHALTYLSHRCYLSTVVLNTTAMRTPARIFWWQDDADPNGQTLAPCKTDLEAVACLPTHQASA